MLHLYYAIGRPRHRTSLSVVAYRDDQLYCICTGSWDGREAGAAGHQLAVVAYGDGGGGGGGRKEQEQEESEENLTTTTLTVGNKRDQLRGGQHA